MIYKDFNVANLYVAPTYIRRDQRAFGGAVCHERERDRVRLTMDGLERELRYRQYLGRRMGEESDKPLRLNNSEMGVSVVGFGL